MKRWGETKKNLEDSGEISEDLKACADVVDVLDAKMYSLNEAISAWNNEEKR